MYVQSNSIRNKSYTLAKHRVQCDWSETAFPDIITLRRRNTVEEPPSCLLGETYTHLVVVYTGEKTIQLLKELGSCWDACDALIFASQYSSFAVFATFEHSKCIKRETLASEDGVNRDSAMYWQITNHLKTDIRFYCMWDRRHSLESWFEKTQ